MILNKGQNNQVIEIGVGDTKRNVGVSTNNVDKLKYLLSEGLYKNPIHSTVREICSNMLDAYVGYSDILENPSYIILTENDITFTDFGKGMSRDLVEKIYSQMLNSTKEGEEDSLGSANSRPI